jgi:transposase-like protein
VEPELLRRLLQRRTHLAGMTLPPKTVSLAEWFNASNESGNDEAEGGAEGALHDGFKLEAVRLVKGGQSIAAAARTLGVVDQTLFSWAKAKREGKLTGADSKPVSAEQMEITRLRAGDDGARHPGKSDGVLRQGSELKYAFIQRHRHVWPISVQCRVLQVSVAGSRALRAPSQPGPAAPPQR